MLFSSVVRRLVADRTSGTEKKKKIRWTSWMQTNYTFCWRFWSGILHVVKSASFLMSSLYKLSTTIRKLHSSAARFTKNVEFTAVRYPYIKRGSYSFLSDRHLRFFQSILSPHQVLTDEFNDLSGYNVDWMRSVRGTSKIVCFLTNVFLIYMCFHI